MDGETGHVHPAMSATIATASAAVASGLLVWLGLIAPGAEVPKTALFGISAFAPAIGGIFAALVHSAGQQGTIPGAPGEHVQWLARTRFLLALNLVPAGLLAFGWIVLGTAEGFWRAAGLMCATLGVLTLFAHARVYVAVPSVPEWRNKWIVLNSLAIGLLAGALWLNALIHMFGVGSPQVALLSVVAVFFAFYIKRGHWREVDRIQGRRRLMATGPGEDHGGARPPFYFPPERTRRLRRLAFILMLAVPLALGLVGMDRTSALSVLFAIAAALSGTVGIVIERWLFFTDTSADADTESVDLLA